MCGAFWRRREAHGRCKGGDAAECQRIVPLGLRDVDRNGGLLQFVRFIGEAHQAVGVRNVERRRVVSPVKFAGVHAVSERLDALRFERALARELGQSPGGRSGLAERVGRQAIEGVADGVGKPADEFGTHVTTVFT